MGRSDNRRCGRCGAVLRRGNFDGLCDPCSRAARFRDNWAGLPGHFYTRTDVVTALTTYDFGRFFKAARSEMGVSQEEFGLLVGLAQSRVCKIENGALRLRDVEAVARLTSTLGTPAELLGFVADVSTLEGNHDEQAVSWLQRRDFVAAVTAMALGAGVAGSLHDRLSALVPTAGLDPPRRVGLAEVERIEATTAAFRDWDNRWGGGLSRLAVIGQLQWVIASAKNAVASDSIQRRLMVATADLASLGAWINYDVERHDEARRLWMLALDASREAGNLDLVGAILSQLAHQALHLKRPDEALRLIRLAYATTADPDYTVPELALSEIAAYEALCHAAAGNLRPCTRALGKAEEHFDNSSGYDAPPWLAHFDEVELSALRGHAYHALADRIPAAAQAAEPLLRDAVTRRGPQFARSKTLNLIALSSTYFQQGTGIEEGVRVGYEALEAASSLNSPRSLSRLQGLDSVSARFSGEPDVAEFRDQLQLVLADAS